MKDDEPSIIFNSQVPGLNPRLLNSFVTKAAKTAGLRGVPDILITNNRMMRRLNSRFRGKNSTTDVLSFPALAVDGCVGDIVISADVAAYNSRAMRHSVSDEVQILILHGILHLAGYDHENDQGEMAEREMALRKKLGLPSGLIERNSKPKTSLAPSTRYARSERAVRRSSLAKPPRSGSSGQRTRVSDQRHSRT